MSKHHCRQEDDYHPSADGSDRFPVDRLLRQHGYRIHSRPPKGEPRWEKGGVVFRQGEALLRAKR